MVWQAVAANVAGEVAGKLLGGGDGPGMKQQLNDQYRIQQEWSDYAFHSKMNLAQQYKIHPLAMLGAQVPQVSGAVYESNKTDNMGQNVSRALAKGVSDHYTRKANQELEDLAKQKAQAEIDLIRAQTTSINKSASTVSGTPIGSSVQQAPMGQSDSYVEVPAENTKGMQGRPQGQGGAIPELGYTRTSNTRLDLVMSEQYKERAEDDIIQQLKWHGKHSLPVASRLRHMMQKPPYPDVPVPKGYNKWIWASDHWKASKQ